MGPPIDDSLQAPVPLVGVGSRPSSSGWSNGSSKVRWSLVSPLVSLVGLLVFGMDLALPH